MKPNRDAILLSKVQSLTLRGGSPPPLTTHRRVPAIPQLTCISSPRICALHTIETLRCTNQGSGYDSEDIQWSCIADLPSELKLGSTDVICEGYSRSDDPYILKGSCGVEYRLALTESGEAKWPDLAKGGDGGWGGGGGKDGERDPSAWLFGVIFIAVAVWIVYSACTAPRRNAGRRALGNGGGRRGGGGGGGGGGGWGPGGGGGGGGGGDENWNDPPPPYPGNNKSPYNTQPRAGQGQQQQGWRPGFWSGVLGGAAAGYMAGGRNNTRSDNGNRNYGGTSGGGGWGGNSGGGWGGSSTSSSRSNSAGSASGPSYESTGFGGTSRR